MSLKQVAKKNTINGRKQLLSKYLKDNEVGELSKYERKYFKFLFKKYYKPDDEYEKFKSKNIKKVFIRKSKWGNNNFVMLVNNEEFNCSIARLAGSNRTVTANVKRAMRNDIEEQIIEFKKNNPLDVNAICPVEYIPLGYDAQVDHVPPFTFSKLSNDWLKMNTNIGTKYVNSNYTLLEPFRGSWQKYHSDNCKLRWLSKIGNTKAHR